MKQSHAKVMAALVILILLMLFFSCSKDNPSDSNVGQLTVKITDAPFPIALVEYAEVTIKKVEIRSITSDEETSYIALTDDDFAATFDLLQLQNGVTGDVVQMEIPVGSYDLVRLHVDSAAIKVKDSAEYHLKVPSGSQTGIKVFVNPPIEVAGGLSAELLLDFDINKSFVVKGNPNTLGGVNGFIFKPVIRGINRSEAGRISGYVKNTSNTAVKGATVWTEIASSDTLLTLTETDGSYALVGLEPGIYTVTAQDVEHDTISVEDINVVAGNNTEQNFMLTPID
jgi:hypothetical protein